MYSYTSTKMDSYTFSPIEKDKQISSSPPPIIPKFGSHKRRAEDYSYNPITKKQRV